MRDNGCVNVRRSYLLAPVQDATIKSVAKDNGSSSESAALRFIIEDWARMKAEAAGIPLQAPQRVSTA